MTPVAHTPSSESSLELSQANIPRSKTAAFTVPKERFSDIAGSSGVVRVLQELSVDIKSWLGKNKFIDLPKGILFYGSGSEKFLLASALAGESGCKFHSVSAHTFLGARNGEGEITRIFDSIGAGNSNSEKQVSILHIEDFHLLFEVHHNGEIVQVPTKLLHGVIAQMIQRAKDSENHLIVIASADGSIVDSVNSLSPYFDHSIAVSNPASVPARIEILNKIFEKKFSESKLKLPSPEDLHNLARLTAGTSVADLEALLRHAVHATLRASKQDISLDYFVEGVQRQIRGNRDDKVFSEQEVKRVDVHEDGHGIVAYLCDIPILLISNSCRGNSGGCVMPDPSALGENLRTKKQALIGLLIGFGGMEAERCIYGNKDISESGSSDLRQIRQNIGHMISSGLFIDKELSILIPSGSMASRDASETLQSLVTNARLTVSKLLKNVGKEKFEKMAAARNALGGDLCGTKAEQFYNDFISASDKKSASKILENFLENPFEKST